jgi:hypothetical protein
MRRSEKTNGEPERKEGELDDNAPSILELSKGLKEFYAGIISQVTEKVFVAKIVKLNEELEEWSRNYNDMRMELEEIENGNRIPSNSNSH